MKKRGNIQKLILFFLVFVIFCGNIYYTQDVFASNNNISNSVTNKTSKVDDFKKAYEDGFYNTNDDWSVTENFYSEYIPNDIKAYNKATTNVSDVKISVEFKEKENNKGIAYLTDKKKKHSENKATDNLFIGKLDTNKTPTLGIFTQAGEDEGKLNTSERWNFEGSKFVGTLTITFDKEVENPILDLSGIGAYRKVFGTETDVSKKYAKGSFSASELELKNADITVEKVGSGNNLQVENKKIKVINKNTSSQSVLDKTSAEDAENTDARTPDLSPAGTGSVMLVGKMKEVTFDVYHGVIPFSKFSTEQYHTGKSYFTKEEDKKCADGVNGLNTLITEEVCKDIFKDEGTKLYNSDLFLISIRLAKRGSVDVKYITTDGKILENVTDVVKDELVGKDYITVQKSFNGYVFEKIDTNSAPTTGKVKEEKQHVIYVYREHIPGFPLMPARKNITATKVWIDAPEEKPRIYFKLYRKLSGQKEGEVSEADVKEVKLDNKDISNEEDKRKETATVTWGNMPVTDAEGKIYEYTVKEVDEKGKSLELKEYIKKEEGLTVTNAYVKPTSGYNDIEMVIYGGFVEVTEDTATEIISGENPKQQEEREDSKPVYEIIENNLIEFGGNTLLNEEGGENIGNQVEIDDSKPLKKNPNNPIPEKPKRPNKLQEPKSKQPSENIPKKEDRPTLPTTSEIIEIPETGIISNKKLPKTGENSNLPLYSLLMFVSGVMLIILQVKQKKKIPKDNERVK
ncbi:TPA: MucBP domain-containing protein [Streptococcus agalactiae]|nr:MucBP domain-containing protein [Streptococcus agalactiae]